LERIIRAAMRALSKGGLDALTMQNFAAATDLRPVRATSATPDLPR